MKLRSLLPPLMLAATLALSVPLIAGFFGARHPALDSFAHFRVHLAALLALGGGALLATRFRPTGIAAILLAAGATVTAMGGPAPALALLRGGSAHADASGASYRLLHMNLRFDNATPEKAVSLIGRVKPDIISLNEVSPHWLPWVSIMERSYPHSIVCLGQGMVGGTALLSRRPFADGTTAHCALLGAVASSRYDLNGQTVDVTSMHLPWPWPHGQKRAVDALVDDIGRMGETGIVVGDFNATTWSATVRRVADAGSLSITHGMGATWFPLDLPHALRPWLGLPIDQVMTKGAVATVSAGTQEDIGSDHAPVLLEFRLGNPPSAPTEPDEPSPAIQVSL